MITDKITENVLYSLQQVYSLNKKSADVEIVKPDGQDHGDFSTNIAFRIAKEVGKNPREIAEKLAESLEKNGGFAKVEAVNGFINFYLDHEYFENIIKEILKKGDKYAGLDILKGQKIQVEFISANPTGPLTLANGRGGFGGDALANVLAKAGAKVEREYYVNDGGNQVKTLGISILAAAGLVKTEEDIYRGEYIETWAKQNEDSVKKFRDKPFELGQVAAHDILENMIKPSVANIGIKFDNWFSENNMIERGEVDEAIAKLVQYGHTKEEDGALWMKTTTAGDDKDRVLVKADGEKTYFANDIAYHFDKFYKRGFNRVINFWGADHHGYVGRMLAAVALSIGAVGKLDIVIFQLVHLIKDGQEFKMSKRKGTYVTMDDLLVLIGGNKKSPSTSAQDLREASDVARFFFLMRSWSTHMDFDLDLAREHTEKNPVFYVKYAFARLSGILKNAKDILSSPTGPKKSNQLIGDLPNVDDRDSRLRGNDGSWADLSLLKETEELNLIDQLSQLPQIILTIISMNDYPVHYLTYYAIDTAKRFHTFYDKCRVIDEDNLELTAARLELVRATQIVLGIVMRDLIGIDAPERM